jgi:hypothetical protein
VRRVRVLVAERCHLCEAALEVVERVRAETAFDLEIVDITGDPELERRYRTEIPVVEIDGERAFAYFVQADALRRRVRRPCG